jgi:hypothetical protein
MTALTAKEKARAPIMMRKERHARGADLLCILTEIIR